MSISLRTLLIYYILLIVRDVVLDQRVKIDFDFVDNNSSLKRYRLWEPYGCETAAALSGAGLSVVVNFVVFAFVMFAFVLFIH